MQITPEHSVRDVLQSPVGKDVLDLVALHLGISRKLFDNPVTGLVKIKQLPKLTMGVFDDGLIDTLINLVNLCEGEELAVSSGGPSKKWWKEAVFYQIYPRSFNDSNGDGIGDLRGVIEKLDYLKELGVDVIWLSPIYDSPNDDNGYDIRDYRKIMPEFGTMEDFDELLEGVHNRGMKLIMDLVVNHTSDEHEWFQKALAGEKKYQDYYIHRKTEDGNPPNNWQSFFSGSAWNYYEHQDEWYLHLFSKKQMDLNWENPEVRAEIADMVSWWLEKGVDGFRMDVINLISKAEGLPDGSDLLSQTGMIGAGMEHCFYGPKLHEYLRELQANSFSKYDAFSVGETPGVGVEMSKFLTDESRKEIDMVFLFDHLESPGHERFSDYVYKLSALKTMFSKYQGLPQSCWPSLFLENHDNPRFVSKVNPDPKYRTPLSKLLVTMTMTLRGTPFIFQGQEIGMMNCAFKDMSEIRDVESINKYKELTGKGKTHEEAFKVILAGSRDHARTPVQWDDSENAGFTTGTPWIRVTDDYPTCNVKRNLENPNSILHYFQSVIALRKSTKALAYGDFELMKTGKNAFCYYRSYEGERYYIEMNLTERSIARPRPAQGSLLLSNYGATLDNMRPYEANIYQVS